MIRNLAALLLAALALCGCVLESRLPLFAETQGVLVAGLTPPPMAAWNLKDGNWMRSGPSNPPLQLVAEAHHYVAIDPENPGERMSMLFVPIDEGRYALQFSTNNEPNTAYAIAEIEGHDILVKPMFCTELQKTPEFEADVGFGRDTCLIKSTSNATGLMARFARVLPAADMKLAPLP